MSTEEISNNSNNNIINEEIKQNEKENENEINLSQNNENNENNDINESINKDKTTEPEEIPNNFAYESEGESFQTGLKQIKRKIRGKFVDENVSVLFAFALECGRKETIDEQQLPPNLSVKECRLNWKSEVDGSSALHIAAELGKAPFLRQLLQAGIKKSTLDMYDNTPLIRAVRAGRTETSLILLKKMNKEQINIQNAKGETALFFACANKLTQVVERLLKHGADINLKTKENVTTLMVACGIGDTNIIKMIIEKEPNFEDIDDAGENCLHYLAKSKCNDPQVLTFFRNKSNIAEVKDKVGNQPLYYATQTGTQFMIDFFLHLTSLKDVRILYNNENFIEDEKEMKETMVTESSFFEMIRANKQKSGNDKTEKTPRIKKEDREDSTNKIKKEESKIKEIYNKEEENQKDVLTDIYGYVIKDGKLVETPKSEKEIVRQRKREVKWVAMLEEWVKFEKQPKKLWERVYKGVPHSLRAKYWLKAFDVERCVAENKGYYFSLANKIERLAEDAQIHKDVQRAHQNNIHFKNQFTDGQKVLFRVLRAYSVRDRELGYIQGMADICGCIVLIIPDEEQIFWCLNQLMIHEKFNLRQFPLNGFRGVKKMIFVHLKMIKKYLPKIHEHQQKIKFNTSVHFVSGFYLEYYMCFLVRCLPTDLTFRILDVLLCEGWEIIFSIVSSVLYFSQSEILKIKDPDQLAKVLADPFSLMKGYEINKFMNHIKVNRINPKEIRKWYDRAEKVVDNFDM